MSDLSVLRTNKKITVLLIDDEIRLLKTLTNYLESKGILVFAAESPQIAFNILDTVIPDILIVDVIMPNETGYEFISKLKMSKRLGAIPFIFLTAKGMTKDRIKGYNLGCRAYITKPFDPEELVSVISSIFNEIKNLENIKKIKTEIRKIRLYLENKSNEHMTFTPREKLILFEIIQGRTNLAIADKMEITVRNVERYITRLLEKTNTKSRTDLIRLSYKFYQSLKANDENRTRE